MQLDDLPELPRDGSWQLLTSDGAKFRTFAADADFMRGMGWVQDSLGTSAATVLHRHALLVIQPDCFARRMGQRCIEFAIQHGFRPVYFRRVLLDPDVIKAMWVYQSDSATPDSDTISDLVCSRSESLLVVFRDESPEPGTPASLRLSRLKGSARPDRRTSQQLRSVIGAPEHLVVLVHTSDEPVDIIRETAILCGPACREVYEGIGGPVPGDVEARLAAEITQFNLEVEAHDLDPGAALERMRSALAALASVPAKAGPAQLLLTTLARVQAKEEPLDWQPFAGALRELGFDPTNWDPVLVGSRYVETDVAKMPRRFAIIHPLPGSPDAQPFGS